MASNDRDWTSNENAALEFGSNAAATLLLLARAHWLLYAGSMLSVRLRRLVHFVLALTLAGGLAAQGVRAADMSAKANNRADAMAPHMNMAAAASMPMCNKCDACKNGSCKGNGCMSSGTCAAYCGIVAALPVIGAVVEAPHSESAPHAASPRAMGWAAPPDPYPPRTTILS